MMRWKLIVYKQNKRNKLVDSQTRILKHEIKTFYFDLML